MKRTWLLNPAQPTWSGCLGELRYDQEPCHSPMCVECKLPQEPSQKRGLAFELGAQAAHNACLLAGEGVFLDVLFSRTRRDK
jgi:hypothetical protein